jgi:hypothetical protein
MTLGRERSLDARIDELESRAEIAEVVMRYVRAIDRCDEALLRSCYHPGAVHEHGAFKGLAAEFCVLAMEIVGRVEMTHHQLGPVSVELAGDRAYVETYFTSVHRFGATPPEGGLPHEDRTMGGRYIDLFERRDGRWLILRRRGINEWLRYEAPSDRGFLDRPSAERGRRNRSDAVYSR